MNSIRKREHDAEPRTLEITIFIGGWRHGVFAKLEVGCWAGSHDSCVPDVGALTCSSLFSSPRDVGVGEPENTDSGPNAG
jgi:hypothetical protein